MVQITKYIFTPKDLIVLFMFLIERMRIKDVIGIIYLLMFFIALAFLKLPLYPILFAVISFIALYWKIHSGIPITLSIILLIFVILIEAYASTQQENTFVYAIDDITILTFYFLILGTLIKALEIVRSYAKK